jgi:phage shock protein A
VTDSSSMPPEPINAETVPSATPVTPASDYDERGVPTLDYVRDKIESRFTTAMGDAELTEGSLEARSLDEQQAQREQAAKAKLDEIRRTLRG